MKKSEISELLTFAAAFDRRKIGMADVDAWYLALGKYDWALADCKAAVAAHYADSTDYLMPAHVKVRVQAIRAERPAERSDHEITGEVVYPERLLELVSGLMSSTDHPDLELESAGAGRTRGGLTPQVVEMLAQRHGQDPEFVRQRLAALAVDCPVCKVLAGSVCVNDLGQPLTLVPAHLARLYKCGAKTPPSPEARDIKLRELEELIAREASGEE